MLKKAVLAVFLVIACFSNGQAGICFKLDPVKQLKNLLDFSCIDFKVEGICIKHKHGKIKIGIKISYYAPVALVETPPGFQTSFVLANPVLQSTESLVGKLASAIPILSATSYEVGGNIEDPSGNVGSVFYREAHVFAFPGITNPVLDIIGMTCGKSDFGFFFFASETDPLDWRFGFGDYLKAVKNLAAQVKQFLSSVQSFRNSVIGDLKSLPERLSKGIKDFTNKIQNLNSQNFDWKNLLEKAQEGADKLSSALPDGGWGSMTPHIGYVHEVSDVIAYHLMAVRALDLSFSLKPRWGVDKFQMLPSLLY